MDKFGLVKIGAIYLLFNLILIVNTFNLSPQPNYIFKEPKLNTFLPKYESSYFGYAINLRTNSIMIGAPKTQSNLDSQRNNNQTGAVYKCEFSTKRCEPYYVDLLGNINGNQDLHSYNNLIKDKQWLGAVMDGHGSENDSFVVCAPNIITSVRTQTPINKTLIITDNYLFHGVCYETANTINARPTFVKYLAPLRIKSKQQIDKKFYYMFGQQGFSVHVSDNSEELLIGAPGVETWKGSVIRYKPKANVDLGGLSRRNIEKPHSIKRRHSVEYDVEAINPNYWFQSNDSYFGYAVTSAYFDGTNSKQLLYVASAPQGRKQTGEVYIYDYIDHIPNDPLEKSIKVYKKFYGQQMGEYFGYGLLADDFNDDGLVDLVISAPMHSKPGSYDNGKVYIFQNKGHKNFDEQTSLMTEYELNGRFGTTLGKLGDINLDGFNDLAVSAPFEENGAVYIFLGSSNGILSKPSQRISASINTPLPFGGTNMFGMGLSRGVDIDGNKFNDLAIGAPNAEVTYVYRSYPVVKIISSIASLTSVIGINDTQFTLRYCWRYDSMASISFNIDLSLSIKLDPQVGRAKFANIANNELNQIVTAKREFQCVESAVLLQFTVVDIFKPILLEMSHDLVTKIPDSSSYCENCVAINPNDLNLVQNIVAFNTGCKDIRCVSDLRIKSSLVGKKPPYILGSTKTIGMEYTIDNLGETAYIAQINVTIPNIVTFYKIPSNCKLDGYSMTCDLAKGAPIQNGEKTTIIITIDSTKLDGKELVIQAETTSSGDELVPEDNSIVDVIPLEEFSEIEIQGKSSSPSISVEEIGLKIYNITNKFEIRNLGPSVIKELSVIISIPLVYVVPRTKAEFYLIEFDDIKAKGIYNNREYDIVWSKNEKIIKQNRTVTTASPSVIDNLQGMEYDTSKVGLEFDLEGNDIKNRNEEDNTQSLRRKRFASHKEGEHNYNRYTQRTIHRHDVSRRSVSHQYDSMYENLPKDRTLIFNCDQENEHYCVEGKVDIHNFKPGDIPIYIEISFGIDLNKVDYLYTDDRDIFLMITSSEILKFGDNDGRTMKIVNYNPYSIITKYIRTTTPIWVYVVSTIVGILLLIIICYVLYKMGFFQRTKKAEMEKLTRESQIQQDNEDNEESRRLEEE